MSEAGGHAASAADDHAHEHPRYMLIWLYLAILTILEVLVAFLAIPKWMIVVSLLIMAVWKALLVALYYMHLKFEPNRLRLVALAPLPAVAIMIIAIMMEYV
ncbi:MULTISPECIES: cytochrome C oxidase subunit IV family protein [Candidatus Palauibacter]|uniref:cytochrome C oxidase subunit IV family protein n=1 Tax=Candidatus Palauibacter TaxID=3056650 RepID=UPI00239A8CF7|nr:cytochrome C oxidase subunit IV family protein [Candidatus Palauibacter soopunensis]MDE2879206.1 cytochrome C oxidase subunit IV family protein [Candidatus Palauibacter soopunensis]